MDEVGVVGVKENEELDAIRKKWCVCMGGGGGGEANEMYIFRLQNIIRTTPLLAHFVDTS